MNRTTPSQNSSRKRTGQAKRSLPLGLHHHGEINWYVIGMILALIVLIVLAIIITNIAGTANRYTIGPARLSVTTSSCYSHLPQLTQPCNPNDRDKDGDCLDDSCDPCIDLTKTTPAKTDLEQLQAGSNLFDNDHDLIPDACDRKPQFKDASCAMDTSVGFDRCKTQNEFLGVDGKTKIQLASLKTTKGSVSDFTILNIG